ncbi:hypothetical protein EDC96DRAFT_539348, partial [Choanephora cucurbitarum]
MSWSLSLLFWCPMILVFSVMVSLFSDSGVSYYGLFFSLSLLIRCSMFWFSLFWCFGVALIWSLCSDALVLL